MSNNANLICIETQNTETFLPAEFGSGSAGNSGSGCPLRVDNEQTLSCL